MFQLLV